MSDQRSASLLSSPAALSQGTTAPGGYGTTAKRPANPPLGYLYYDTTLGAEIVWVGAWKQVGASQAPMVGFGPTANRPVNPAPGFVYFDSTLQQSLTWNGSTWVGAPVPVNMTGYGTTANRPVTPPLGFLYFDTTLTKELAYNGGWVEIGPAGALPPANLPVITSATTATGTYGVAFTYQITATNSPTSYGAVGTLPTGLSLDSGTGIISGTPTTPGVVHFVITATNAYGSGSSYLSISIGAAVVSEGRWTDLIASGKVITTNPFICGYTVTASGTMSFFVNSSNVGGTFPPGITYQLVSNGAVLQSGTTSGGETSLTFTQAVTNSSYTLVFTSSSAACGLAVGATVYTAKFSNGSVRGPVAGPSIGNYQLGLTLNGVDPATTIGSSRMIRILPGGQVDTLQPPGFYMAWGGNPGNYVSTANPNLAWPGALTSVTATLAAQSTYSADALIEINGGALGP